MASCARIENSLQAYIDGELGDSDRVIFEEHIAECEVCRESLRVQQRVNAFLFESFMPDRFRGSLRKSVLENLPEIEPVLADIERVNLEAKNPDSWVARHTQWVPVAAAAVLVFVTILLRFSFPEDKSRGAGSFAGVVTQASGSVTRIDDGKTDRGGVHVNSFVRSGDRFETGPGTTLMLALQGPTYVKLNEKTRLKVDDSRKLSLEQGWIWVDVGRDGSLFKVATPNGLITVFGTVFSVIARDNETTVTVERGRVQVANSTESRFRQLESGEQLATRSDGDLTTPVKVDTHLVHAWARRIQPDDSAEALFERTIQANAITGELPARAVYMIWEVSSGSITAVRIYWQPDAITAGHCSYDVHVSDGALRPLFQGRIDGSVFADKSVSSYDIVPPEPINGVRSLAVQLIPDLSTGSVETKDFTVKAQVMQL